MVVAYMWREKSIPDCPSRIRGYSHADLGVCFVATIGGFYVLYLDAIPRWERIGDQIEEYMLLNEELLILGADALMYRDVRFALHAYPLLDDPECEFCDIPLDRHPSGQRLVYDEQTDSAVILQDGNEFQRINIGISEEWTTAGFSSDGHHLTFASLERIRIFEFES